MQDLEAWADETEWETRFTQRSRTQVLVSQDSGECRLNKPTPKEQDERKREATQLSRLAKVAASGKTGAAEALARRLGKTLPEALAKHQELEKAAAHRRARVLKRQSELLLARPFA